MCMAISTSISVITSYKKGPNAGESNEASGFYLCEYAPFESAKKVPKDVFIFAISSKSPEENRSEKTDLESVAFLD